MTNTTPKDLQARMEKLVRWMASSSPRTTEQDAWFCEAQDIVSKLDPHPDVLAVREILSGFHHEHYVADAWFRGDRDKDPRFISALVAYRRIKAGRA